MKMRLRPKQPEDNKLADPMDEQEQEEVVLGFESQLLSSDRIWRVGT